MGTTDPPMGLGNTAHQLIRLEAGSWKYVWQKTRYVKKKTKYVG
jgi:hypothetical protein